MSDTRSTLLVVDDDSDIAQLIGETAERVQFRTVVATDPITFMQAMVQDPADAVILDLEMAGFDGLQALRHLADQQHKAGILIITGADARTAAAAEHYGATRGLRMLGVLHKPFDLGELRTRLEWVLSQVRPLTAADLQDAILKDQLTIHYQPTLALGHHGSRTIDSVEALLRWRHPDRSLLPAAAFLDLSDRSGLTETITDFVLQRSVEQLRVWNDQQIPLKLRVNVSVKLIADRDFPDRLSTLLSEHDIASRSLIIELNETAALAGDADTLDILTRLRLKGVCLSLDDFGAGGSHLRHLKDVPFTELKIDGSLLNPFKPRGFSEGLVRGVIDLGHRLGMTVCAEGVESEAALSFLASAHCDSAQGHFIGHAVPAAEITKLLTARQPLRAPA